MIRLLACTGDPLKPMTPESSAQSLSALVAVAAQASGGADVPVAISTELSRLLSASRVTVEFTIGAAEPRGWFVAHDPGLARAPVACACGLSTGGVSGTLVVHRMEALEPLEVDATAGIGRILPAFDAALVASGTASLECAIAGVVPVVAYKVDLVTEAFARLLLRTPYVALPNVLLGRRAFDELVQRDVGPTPLAHALARALDDDARKEACAEVVRLLGDRRSPSAEVARIVRPYLFG